MPKAVVLAILRVSTRKLPATICLTCESEKKSQNAGDMKERMWELHTLDSELAGLGWKRRYDAIMKRAKETKMKKKLLKKHEHELVRNVEDLPLSVIEQDMKDITETVDRTDDCKSNGHLFADVALLGKNLQCFGGMAQHFVNGKHKYGGLKSQKNLEERWHLIQRELHNQMACMLSRVFDPIIFSEISSKGDSFHVKVSDAVDGGIKFRFGAQHGGTGPEGTSLHIACMYPHPRMHIIIHDRACRHHELRTGPCRPCR